MSSALSAVSPVISPASAVYAGPRRLDDLERELKFVLPATRADIAERWLRTACEPDGQFAEADVWTVYYDTPTFQSLDEKLNSDYLKTKIRLRWYATPGEPGRGPAFVEAKSRVGTRRDKIRVRLSFDAAAFTGRGLEDPLYQRLPGLLAEKGVLAGPAWQPMLALRYRRSRFVERRSGARINFDRHITAVRVNHRYLTAQSYTPLALAVLEAKSLSETLPSELHPLVTLGARKAAFSKYAALLAAIQNSPY